jgi:hypothetical protein
MALGIYRLVSPGVYEKHSEDGSASNPITTKHHGRNGDIFELKRFVRADDDHTYTNIQVAAQSLDADDDIGEGSNPGNTGWGVKLLLDTGSDPTETDWDAVNYGDPIDIVADDESISDDSTYIAFWYRIESPPGEDVKTKTNVGLYLYYTDTPTP